MPVTSKWRITFFWGTLYFAIRERVSAKAAVTVSGAGAYVPSRFASHSSMLMLFVFRQML